MAESSAKPEKLSFMDRGPLKAGLSANEAREQENSSEIRNLASLLEISKALSGDQGLGAPLCPLVRIKILQMEIAHPVL